MRIGPGDLASSGVKKKRKPNVSLLTRNVSWLISIFLKKTGRVTVTGDPQMRLQVRQATEAAQPQAQPKRNSQFGGRGWRRNRLGISPTADDFRFFLTSASRRRLIQPLTKDVRKALLLLFSRGCQKRILPSAMRAAPHVMLQTDSQFQCKLNRRWF